jgi:methionyl aminopeptidase
MITIKSKSEIETMKKGGEILARTLLKLEENINPGITTGELDRIAEEFITGCESFPSFKGYKIQGMPDFPASICASVNEEVVHGIPNRRILQEGDIISIDVGVYYNGLHVDAARTFPVGTINEKAQSLIETTRQSFFQGIKNLVPGKRIIDISSDIQEYVELKGFSVVRDYVGHGIGRQMHEDPQIPNYKTLSRGPRIDKGMTFAIEPMVNVGESEVKILDNRWTVVTVDGTLSAHYENTVLVTGEEPLILTKLS